MLTSSPENVRRSSSDRFIPRRANANFDLSYYPIKKIHTDDNSRLLPLTYSDAGYFLNTARYFHRLQKYRTELWKTMMPDKKRVFVFSSPKKKMEDRNYENLSENIWPVHSRSQPLMGAPSIILDMPDLDTNICHHVVDWGRKGYIGTIYENEVHLWHPEQNVRTHVTNTLGRVLNCVKWDRDGTNFAMTLRHSSIGIWNCDTCKTKTIKTCRCLHEYRRCSVTAIEWTRNNCLITGCSEGRLCSWTPDFVCIKTFVMAHIGDIINIKISCNENYLVTTGIDKAVRLWKWPDFEEFYEIAFHRAPVKAVAWHPWKDSLLALCGPQYTTIWNVNILKPLGYSNHIRENYFVDCITFNPLSAELVVSYYYAYGNADHTLNFLTVMKDLDNVVDEVIFHNGRVPYLLWDSAGTKLATASSDENLCIWDFFGTNTKTEKKYQRLTAKKKFSTNMLKNLNIFNSFIR